MNTRVNFSPSIWYEWYQKFFKGKLRPFLRFLVLSFLMVLFFGWLSPPSLSFTPGRWSFAKKHNNTWLLVAMREDLVVQLKGSRMTKQEVTNLLGPPDQDIRNSTRGSVASYQLGASTSGGFLPVFRTLHIIYWDEILEGAGVSRD